MGITSFNKIGFSNLIHNNLRFRLSKIESWPALIAGIGIAITLMGILYNIQSWPGAFTQLTAGLIALIFAFIINMIKYRQDNAEFYKWILIPVAAYSVIAIFFFISTYDNVNV